MCIRNGNFADFTMIFLRFVNDFCDNLKKIVGKE